MGKSRPLAARYWEKVDRSSSTGCWPWTGATSGLSGRPGGSTAEYGSITVNGRTLKAHRVGWTLIHGPIAEGLCVCHTCDNGLCQRPDHHFLGTHKENMEDSSAKGRRSRPRNTGRANPRAKLSDDDVRAIRVMVAEGQRQVDVAAAFGIGQPQVSDIARRVKWTHVD
jgi:hypothetical protein